MRRRALAAPVAALAMLAGAGCTSGAAVLVDISVPRPLVEPLGARVGVYYEDALTSYVHQEEVDGGSYVIDIGASQAPVFSQVFGAMFETVVPMRRPAAQGSGDGAPDATDAQDGEAQQDPQGEQDAQKTPPIPFHRVDGGGGQVDIVLAPAIDEVQFSTPKQTNSDFYEVWIRYRMRLFDSTGSKRIEWPLVGYGKASNRNSGDSTEILNAATTWALRDAAAVLAFELRDNIAKAAGDAAADTAGESE